MKVACPLHKMALKNPSAIAIDSLESCLSYKNLDKAVIRAANTLAYFGIKTRDKVALLSENSPFVVTILWALLRLKAKVCLINPKEPLPQIKAFTDRLGAKYFISENPLNADLSIPTFVAEDLINQTIQGITKGTSPLSPPFVNKQLEPFIDIHPTITQGVTKGTSPFKPPFVNKQVTSFIDIHSSIEWNKISTLMMTSGSGGYQKIAAHSLSQHLSSAKGSLKTLLLDKTSRYHLSLPLYHVGGLSIIFRSFLAGSTLVIKPMPKESTAHWIHENKITHLSFVITQLKRLMEVQTKPPSCLKRVLLGGSAFPRELLSKAIKLSFPIVMSYGLTEMSSMVTAQHLQASSDLSSLGKPLPYRKLKINSNGEILVKGPTLFRGYFEKNKPTLPPHGWFNTKDLGSFENHNLFFEGRKSRLIISGGENIHPEEIESLMLSLKDIEKAIVIDVEDQEFGQKAVAFIETKSFETSLDTLRALLAASLPRYKIPKTILPWPVSLLSETLKVTKETREKLRDYFQTIMV